eukprot:5309439-Amphidinium_carterae.2
MLAPSTGTSMLAPYTGTSMLAPYTGTSAMLGALHRDFSNAPALLPCAIYGRAAPFYSQAQGP